MHAPIVVVYFEWPRIVSVSETHQTIHVLDESNLCDFKSVRMNVWHRIIISAFVCWWIGYISCEVITVHTICMCFARKLFGFVFACAFHLFRICVHRKCTIKIRNYCWQWSNWWEPRRLWRAYFNCSLKNLPNNIFSIAHNRLLIFPSQQI